MAESEATGAESAVLEAIDRLRARLWQRDRAIVDCFADGADTLLVGSEAVEVAYGRAEIAELFHSLFALPVHLRRDWGQRAVTVAGDIAWFSADCDVVIADGAGEGRKPYRMTGVLQCVDGVWKRRQFHGSERRLG